VDAGDDFSSDFTKVASYTSNALTHTVDVAQDNVETGKIYRFKTTATNDFGESDYSQEVIIGVGQQVPAPSQVLRDYFYGSSDSMHVVWFEP
jgi:hypothetical protein